MASTQSKSDSIPRVRHYREFLTPALHRRFVKAAGIVLAVCFVEGICARSWSSLFWLLFPLGRTGIFALLASISALVIFLLRLTHLHFGKHITQSPASTIVQTFLSAEAVQTLIFYVASAWWFGEIYLSTKPDEYRLVVEGRSYERPRVNEWPVYLRCHFILLAVIEACIHTWRDNGRVQLPLPTTPADKKRAPSALAPLERIRATVGTLLSSSIKVAFPTASLFPFVYPFTVRALAWSRAVSLARILWSVSKSTETPEMLPFHYTVLLDSFTSGVMLLFLWRMSNFAFGAFVAMPPVKASKTLSDDSKDPNGSLLLGLRAKKELVREFAFWELNHISLSDEARRNTIFRELDRKEGPTWSQVLDASLKPIEAISERIADFIGPTADARAAQGKKVMDLPILSAPLHDCRILRAPPKANNTTEAIESAFGDFAKSVGESSSLSPFQVLLSSAQKFLGPQIQKALGLDTVIKSPATVDFAALGAAVVSFYQENPARQASMVILGAPRSDLRPILLSIDSITNLALRALDEDRYGKVAKDVPRILRSLVRVSSTTQKFLREGRDHGSLGRTDDDIDLLFCFLREALRALLDGYGRFGNDIGLGPSEVREVQRAARLG